MNVVRRVASLAIPIIAIAALVSCKAREGDRCICAEDCRAGLLCLADGDVLQNGECSPAAGPGAEPGICVDEAAAGEGEDEIPEPEIFLDLGSKRDWEPGVPPGPLTGTDTGLGTGTTATDDATTGDPATGTTADTSTGTGTSGDSEGSSTGTATGTGTTSDASTGSASTGSTGI